MADDVSLNFGIIMSDLLCIVLFPVEVHGRSFSPEAELAIHS